MSVGIYTITSPTNKVYVGQSWNLERRQSDYLKMNCRGQRKLYNSIKKHRWSAHKFKVVLELRDDTSQEWLNYWETLFWNYYKKQGIKMLNLRLPGSKGKHSEETKQKISKSKIGKQVGENNPFYGKTHSEETKIFLKSRPVTEETKKKMSLAWEYRIVTDATKAKLKEIQLQKRLDPTFIHPNKGKPSKIKGAKLSPRHIRNIEICHHRRSVERFNLDGTLMDSWPSIKEATKVLRINNIGGACRGKQKTAGGFIWKYKEIK